MQVKVRPFSLEVEGYEEEKERWIATLLTLANGRIGVRGELDFVHFSTAGSFLAGLYDDVPVWRRELVMLPRFNANYLVGVEPEVERLVRRLDMRRGVLRVEARLRPGVSYVSESLAHRQYKSVYAQRLSVEAGREVGVAVGLDDPLNPFLEGGVLYEHLVRARTSFDGDAMRVCYGLRSGRELCLRVLLRVQRGSRPVAFRTGRASGFVVMGERVEATKVRTAGRRPRTPWSGAISSPPT